MTNPAREPYIIDMALGSLILMSLTPYRTRGPWRLCSSSNLKRSCPRYWWYALHRSDMLARNGPGIELCLDQLRYSLAKSELAMVGSRTVRTAMILQS